MDAWFPTFWRWCGNTHLPLPSYRPGRTTAEQRQALLRMIAVATEERIPLIPLIDAWSVDERGIQRRRLRKLVRQLQQGVPLADAVEQIPGILRDEEILTIRFGVQSGALAAAIRSMVEQSQSVEKTVVHPVRSSLIYFGIVAAIAFSIFVFINIKINPAFVQILRDFSEGGPMPFNLLMAAFKAFEKFWWLGVAIALILLWSAFSVQPGRYFRRTILGRLFRSVSELRSADLLQKLSLAMRAGRPIQGALSTLARYHFDPAIRHKLLFVRNEVEQGAGAWQSLSTVGLLTPVEMRALTTAERIDNRPWALDQIAFGKRSRTMRRLERLSQWLVPALSIAMGAFVLFQSLAIYLPIINTVTSTLD